MTDMRQFDTFFECLVEDGKASFLSFDGNIISANNKGMKTVREALNRSDQLEIYKRQYDENIERCEAITQTALDILREVFGKFDSLTWEEIFQNVDDNKLTHKSVISFDINLQTVKDAVNLIKR